VKTTAEKLPRPPTKKKPYCPEHQTYCIFKTCAEVVHLKTKRCDKCVKREAQEEKNRKEEEKKQKAKDDADKKKAQQAQSMRDRNFKNKKK
jgi:hypothetical protein